MDEAERVQSLRLAALTKALMGNLNAGTPGPMTAIELAEYCGYGGNHENKRRRVRELIEAAHQRGMRICAATGRAEDCGYWAARNDAEWAVYQAARAAKAKFEFVRLRGMKTAAGEQQSGQQMLFANAEKQKRRDEDMAWSKV